MIGSKDASPSALVTEQMMIMSEPAGRGFHLVDMSAEVWTMHREGG
jgi:hypothetical protein